MKQPLGKKSQSVFNYLLKKSKEDGKIAYHRSSFVEGTGLKASVIHECLIDLEKRQLIHKENQKGACFYTVLNAKTKISKDDPIEKQVMSLIESPAPTPYRYQYFLDQTNFSKNELKKVIDTLLDQGLIKIKKVAKIGNCLIPTEPNLSQSLPIQMKPHEPICYFVDTENINNEGYYRGIKNLKKEDQIILFLSQNSKCFSNPKLLHHLLSECPAKTTTHYIDVQGKNALDFVLVAEITRQIIKYPKKKFCIISNDQGFDAALKHLTKTFNLPTNALSRKKKF